MSKKRSFEKGLLRLEEISEILENNEADLELSIKLYEEATKLIEELKEELEEVKGKISELTGEEGKEDFTNFNVGE